eukprot:gene279-152_t
MCICVCEASREELLSFLPLCWVSLLFSHLYGLMCASNLVDLLSSHIIYNDSTWYMYVDDIYIYIYIYIFIYYYYYYYYSLLEVLRDIPPQQQQQQQQQRKSNLPMKRNTHQRKKTRQDHSRLSFSVVWPATTRCHPCVCSAHFPTFLPFSFDPLSSCYVQMTMK